jgi:17 kDa outer membrane surface antigen
MTMKQRGWAESLLVAYVDGELEPAQAADVEAAIRDDPEAQAIVSVLRRSSDAVKSAFDRPLYEPVPARLLAAAGAASPAAGVLVAGDRIVPLPRRAPRADMRRVLLPLAASILALAIGFGAGYLQFGRTTPLRPATGPAEDAASERFDATLRQVLETANDGGTVAYEDAGRGLRGRVTVLDTLATQSGERCREFRHDIADAAGSRTSHGIACRSADGAWSVLTLPSTAATGN